MAANANETTRISVVIVNFNGAHLLNTCLNSLRSQTIQHQVVLIDNASTDVSIEMLARDFPEVQVVALAANTGFAGGAQRGLLECTSEYVAFLNNDAHAEPGWLEALAATLDDDPHIAAATSKMLLYPSGLVNNVGGVVDRLGVGSDRGYGEPDTGQYDEPTAVFAFCGGAAMLRRSTALKVGGFFTDLFLYYEDTDLSWRLRRAGHEIFYVPDAVVHHLHSASTDQTSELFAFYNLRNHLLTLLRNAPLRTFVQALIRFQGVTVVDVGRSFVRVVARQEQATAMHKIRLRLRVCLTMLALAPTTFRQRRKLQSQALLGRGPVAQRWLS